MSLLLSGMLSDQGQTVFFMGGLLPGMGAGRAESSLHTGRTSGRMPAATHIVRSSPQIQQGSNAPLLRQKVQNTIPQTQAAIMEDTEEPTKAAIDLLQSLTRNNLNRVGIRIDMSSVKSLAWAPVGCRLPHSAVNWAGPSLQLIHGSWRL